jgi:peptidoglycan-N-acetylglucosamine deacetylase
MKIVSQKERGGIHTMGTPNAPVEVDRLSRTINKRVMMVIALSAILVVLGSIALTTSVFWKKSSSTLTTNTSKSSHVVKPTQISSTTPTLSPTKTTAHAPVLGYPLFNGNTHLPEIALTFDDGPNPYYTPQVLAVLQQYNIKATFFDVGYLVADYPNIVRQEYNQGNLVGNHSWSHPVLTLLSAQAILSQLTSTTNAIQAAIGVRPTFFRPPYEAMNHTVLVEAIHLGYTTVLWDGSAGDWKLPGVGVIVSKLLSYTRDGAILLLHDGGGNRAQTVAALPSIITTLEKRGYKFVTIQQLVDDLVAPSSQSAYNNTQDNNTASTAATTVSIAWRRETFS